jgi:hypothetical protein
VTIGKRCVAPRPDEADPREKSAYSPWTVPASESRTFRLIVGVLGSALCLLPLVGMARGVGLIGLPPHGRELVGDVILLLLVLTVVVCAIRAGWRADRDDERGHGDWSGGGPERDAHQYPLFTDDRG